MGSWIARVRPPEPCWVRWCFPSCPRMRSPFWGGRRSRCRYSAVLEQPEPGPRSARRPKRGGLYVRPSCPHYTTSLKGGPGFSPVGALAPSKRLDLQMLSFSSLLFWWEVLAAVQRLRTNEFVWRHPAKFSNPGQESRIHGCGSDDPCYRNRDQCRRLHAYGRHALQRVPKHCEE